MSEEKTHIELIAKQALRIHELEELANSLMEFCVDAQELRKALTEIEAAEKNGFMYCLSVFYMKSTGRLLEQCQAGYSDLIEKAHPTDGSLNWGRSQRVSRSNRFDGVKLVEIK